MSLTAPTSDSQAAAKERALDLLGRLALLSTASYGLLYFSYKYLIPWSGTNDFRRYYPMYVAPLNFSVVPSPFVLRQVSAVLTHLVWKAHIYYPNQIWFNDPAYDQRVFFAALFTNWVCLVLTAFVVGIVAEEMLGERSFLAAVIAGFLCLLSFHSQFVVISGITEGVSWLMFALAFLAYLRRVEWGLLLILVLAIVQREALIVAVACIAAFDLLRDRRMVPVRLRTVVYACICLAGYVALRRRVPGNNHQVHWAGILVSLKNVRFTRAMLTLSFLNQNVIIIAIASRILVRLKLESGHAKAGWLGIFLGTFAVVAFGALCAGLDVDIGRIAGITIPLFAASAAADLLRLDRRGNLPGPGTLRPDRLASDGL